MLTVRRGILHARYTRRYVTTGDGILTSLMVMMFMLDKKMSLSMLADEMKVYPQCLKIVRVKSKPDVQNDRNVQMAVKAAVDAWGIQEEFL